MERTPREAFVPARLRKHAYDDAPLPIGGGQTVSQPYIVALICQGLALGLEGGERVLDVGTGSGYQAAVLAELGAEVHSIVRIPELAERARETLEKAGYGRVTVHVGDGTLGLPEHAPYDGILVAAQCESVPPALVEQLAEDGRLVAPVGDRSAQRCLVLHRRPDGEIEQIDDLGGVRFVPLV